VKGFLGALLTLAGDEIGEADHLGADRTMLEVGVDHAGGLRAELQGLDCATCNDIVAVHGSQGSYDEHWLKYSQRFLDKHRSLIGAAQSVYFKPELVALPVRSVEEWRLLTRHLIEDRG
jgi:hypothetical protein